MIVSQLIDQLKGADPNAEVYVHDADSGHFLRAKVGRLPMDMRYPPPDNPSVILHGEPT